MVAAGPKSTQGGYVTNPRPVPTADDLFRAAENLQATAAKFNDLQRRMNAITATEVSADQRISVTVDSNGVTTAIDLAASTRGMDPRELSAAIMACTRRAQATLRARVTDLVQETVGQDGPGASIIGRYAERFPEPVPQMLAPPPPAHAPVAPPVHTPPPTPPTSPWNDPQSAPLSASNARTPERDQIFIPDEPSEEDEYYRRGSWLV